MVHTANLPKRNTDLQRLFRYRGLPRRVAESLGVSASFVYRVASGKKSSARVLAALEAAIGDVDRRAKEAA